MADLVDAPRGIRAEGHWIADPRYGPLFAISCDVLRQVYCFAQGGLMARCIRHLPPPFPAA